MKSGLSHVTRSTRLWLRKLFFRHQIIVLSAMRMNVTSREKVLIGPNLPSFRNACNLRILARQNFAIYIHAFPIARSLPTYKATCIKGILIAWYDNERTRLSWARSHASIIAQYSLSSSWELTIICPTFLDGTRLDRADCTVLTSRFSFINV